MEGLLEVDEGAPPEKPATATPAADEPPPKKDDEVTLLRRQLKEEQRTRREFQKAAEFWGAQARGAAGKKNDPEPEPEPQITVDLVDAITSGDTKAFTKGLREMGFATEKDVQARISQTRAQISEETKLLAQYPELQDEQSEFFQVTGEIYNSLDPIVKKSPNAVALAARMARAELGGAEPPRRSKRQPPAEDYEPDLDDDDVEQDRVRRVSRQSGDRGRAAARREDGEREELNAVQKSIVAKLAAAGAPITEDSYRKRAQAGVRMGGLPTRRAR
jgi:hypothetical protein